MSGAELLRMFGLGLLLGSVVSPGSVGVAEASRDGPHVVATLPWGDGPGRIGRIEPNESAPEGPGSLAVDATGQIFVLDTVSDEIERVGIGAEPLPDAAWEEMALPRTGGVLLLDRLVGKQVIELPSGRGTPLPAAPEPGLATALFADPARIEYEHAQTVVLDAPARQRSGRPLGDRWVRARIVGPRSVTLVVESAEGAREGLATFSADVIAIRGVEPDREGNTFVLAEVATDAGFDRTEAIVLGPDLRERARYARTARFSPYRPLRAVTAGLDGGIYQLVPTDSGVEVWRW